MKKILIACFLVVLLSSSIFAIEVEKGQQAFIEDATMVAVSDPAVVEIIDRNNRLFVKGLSIGKASLFVWNSIGNLTVVPVTVLSDGTLRLRESLENLKLTGEKSQDDRRLKASYSVRGGFGEGRSSLNTNRFSYDWDVEQVKLEGPSDFGQFEAFLQFERRDAVSQAVLMYTKLVDDHYFAQVGDNWISLSPILGNLIRYQGFQLSNIDLKGTKFDFFAGSTGMAYWGNDVHRSNSLKTGFIGVRAAGRADKNLSFIGSFFSASQFNQPQTLPGSSTIRFNLMSLDGIYDYGPFRLEAEVAQSYLFKQGISSKLNYVEGPFRYEIKYLSVDSDFKTLSDVYNTAGVTGLFQNFNYMMSNELTFFGKFDGYALQTIAPGALYDASVGADFRPIDYPSLRVSISRWDHRNLPHGEVDNAFSLYSSYLVKSDNVRFFGQYSPVSFFTPTSATAISGINHRIRVGAETNTYPFVMSNELGYDSRVLNSQLSVDRSVSNKFKISLYPVTVAKINSAQVRLNLGSSITRKYYRVTAPESYFTTEVRTSVLNWLGDEVYMQFMRDVVDTPSANATMDAYYFEFGINNTFNTGVSLLSDRRKIRGVIFDDLNENGLRDLGEPGISGMSLASDVQVVNTNETGEFTLGFERDEMVSIDTSSNPNAKLKFQNPFSVNLNTNLKIQEAIIPISFEREYTVVSYLDTNKNMRYDDNTDRLLPNAVIKISDAYGSIASFINESGQFSFSVNARSGKVYAVSIDLNSVDVTYIPNSAETAVRIVPATDKSSTLYFGFRQP